MYYIQDADTGTYITKRRTLDEAIKVLFPSTWHYRTAIVRRTFERDGYYEIEGISLQYLCGNPGWHETETEE